MKNLHIWFIVFILSLISGTLSQISLFLQTHPEFENKSYIFKMINSIMVMFLQWAFIIPFMRIGSLVMNPVQITLYAFVMLFIIQLTINIYVFNKPNPMEEIYASFIMIFASFISSFRLIG